MKKALIALIVFVLAFLAFHPFILDGWARLLIVRDKLEPADAIIILGGDDNGERVEEGVLLYHQGLAKRIVMSGGPLAWKLTDAEWMKKHALAIGVPADAILLEDKSVSTLENAKYSLSLMRDNGFKSCIVVTSPPHSRRAQRTFNKIFSPEKIKVTSWPAQQSKFKLHEWWKRHEDTQPVMWETVSLIYYLMLGY